MARLDRVKNLSGLVEWFGKNERLRKLVNLAVVGGFIDSSKSKDREEIAEIEKMHGLIKKYSLRGDFRWICAQKDRVRNGELYRYIADTKGAFIQVKFLFILLKYFAISFLHSSKYFLSQSGRGLPNHQLFCTTACHLVVSQR